MNRTSFERLVQESLDRRQDPLEVAEVLAYLEKHPESLAALVDLRAVGLHRDWPPAIQAGKVLPRKWALLVAAAVLVTAVIFQSTHSPEPQEEGSVTSSILLAQAPTAKVLSIQVTRTSTDSSLEVVHHQSSRSTRILSLHTQTTQNILH